MIRMTETKRFMERVKNYKKTSEDFSVMIWGAFADDREEITDLPWSKAIRLYNKAKKDSQVSMAGLYVNDVGGYGENTPILTVDKELAYGTFLPDGTYVYEYRLRRTR